MSLALPQFANEPYINFDTPDAQANAQQALSRAREQFGKEYPLKVGGAKRPTAHYFASLNPSNPAEIVGRHPVASKQDAADAVEGACAFFPEWSATPVETRVGALLRLADLIRSRRLDWAALLVLEAGKSWVEADADVAEAIDFAEYYARQMLALASPAPPVQLAGETGQLQYLPLGTGIIISPWNFPLAILAGMTTAALVTGNTVVIKPSSDTPTIAARFAEALLEAGFPARSFSLLTGSGAALGDVLVAHPRTRFVSFTGSRDVGLHINQLAATPQPGQVWIKRVIAEMGGKDAIVVDEEADLEAAVQAVFVSAFGFQGQKCSACSRAIVAAPVYDAFLEKLAERTSAIRVGPAEDFANSMGPVISDKAKRTILEYIEQGKSEGRLISGGAEAADRDGYFVQPTIFADVDSKAKIFQEEIFGPVLAVSKARDFNHALALANDSEYGLTGAVFSKNPEKLRHARRSFFVGNLYLNRKCTGAMVGAHPFGGFNMSGTDSKAGGPDYLLQFTQAQSIAERIA